MVIGWKSRIVEEIRRQKLTMKELSRRAGLGDTTVQYILKNSDTVCLETLRRIANALGVCVIYLTFGVHRDVVPSEAVEPK
jgi:transcriptional regulator with XRE-family HTH domain